MEVVILANSAYTENFAIWLQSKNERSSLIRIYRIISTLPAGIRDVIIHAYFGVNLNIIWNTTTERLPELKRDIEKIVEEQNFE